MSDWQFWTLISVIFLNSLWIEYRLKHISFQCALLFRRLVLRE